MTGICFRSLFYNLKKLKRKKNWLRDLIYQILNGAGINKEISE